jgi:hypothetical protein
MISGQRPAWLAAVGLLALSAAACSSSPERAATADAGGASSSFADRFTRLFAKPAAPDGTTAAASTDTTDMSECPPVDIRQGASTLTINGPGAEPSVMSLRYQGSIAQTARECRLVGGNLTIKVGVQGRIIPGPAGGPGQVEVPLRYALVREGPDPKTLWTKLYTFPVVVNDADTSVTFTHVEEDMTVPKPQGAELDAYVIYVGFDQMAAKETKKKPAPAARKKKP